MYHMGTPAYCWRGFLVCLDVVHFRDMCACLPLDAWQPTYPSHIKIMHLDPSSRGPRSLFRHRRSPRILQAVYKSSETDRVSRASLLSDN